MYNPCELIETYTEFFSNVEELSDVSFVHGFTGSNKMHPLTKPVVAVGIQWINEEKVNPVYSEDGTLLYDHLSRAKVSFDIYNPVKKDGIRCFEVFEAIKQALVDSNEVQNIKSIDCTYVRYVRDVSALILPSYVVFETKEISQF